MTSEISSEDEAFMRRAFAVAQSAKEKGNHPFGAVLVIKGQIVLEAENTVATDSDPTGHAETNLMRAAGKKFSREELLVSTMYTSTEPCVMCCGAVYWANVRKIIYGFPESGLRDLTGEANKENPTLLVPCRKLFDFASVGAQFQIQGPVLEEEGKVIHGNFWDAFK